MAKSIRTRTKYVIIGGDYSGQEPRSLCAFSQDKDMQQAYMQKKDLYAVIASKCFHNRYEDNLEFQPQPDGTVIQSQEGKERRSKAKTVFLGILYGMGAKTLASRMELPLEEAQSIIDEFYKGFPAVDNFMKQSQKLVTQQGYVTDIFGRRRHLSDAQLPAYSITSINQSNYFNPLLGAVPHYDKQLEQKIKLYTDKLSKAKRKQERDKIVQEAKADKLKVINNGGFRSRAIRQTVNARIQGSAASMTKLAMSMIVNDPILKELGCRLLATVHDEVFTEAPEYNKDKVAERLCELMVGAAKTKCSFTPWSVDPYVVRDGWYEDENISKIHEDYSKLVKKGVENAYEQIYEKYSMYNKDSLKLVCDNDYTIFKDSLIYGPDYYTSF